MARKARRDGPDTWHHVMNRGLARRTILESDRDRRFFLSCVAREVRAGRLEVHAFCLMLTHFHLLLRSVTGELSDAMKRIQNRYARWFNRTRKRDGKLFKDRFLSNRVEGLVYRRLLVTYIHDNPVDAGLVTDPVDAEWCSACHYAQGRRPRWLATAWVDGECARRGSGETLAERLATAFPSRIEEGFRRWVEKQLSKRLSEELEDVTLKHAGSPRVVRWAIRKAKLADGTRPFRPHGAPHVAEAVIRKAMRRVGPLLGLFRRRAKDAWVNLRAGLLRLVSGCTHREIAMRVRRHAGSISRDLQDHAQLVRQSREYEWLFSRLAHAALAQMRVH